MKKSLLYTTALFSSLAFISCEKCADCTSTVTSNYRFEKGETVNVVSGSALYAGTEYTAGQSFKITYDTSLFDNGLRYEGTGTASLETEVCGKSHTYDNAIELYQDNGWSCKE